MRLHQWVFKTHASREQHDRPGGDQDVDAEVAAKLTEGIGAYVMGRKMFGGGGGEWDESWRGWWGEDPPYHAPVFVLTHHEREPLPMDGGTTFHFATGGIEAALEQAREAAGGQDVSIAGGAGTVNQYLAAGLLDELHLHVAPIVLGAGERLFDGVGDPKLAPIEVIPSPAVTHIRYRVVR
jgi:dihydrofolate reductase